MRVEDLDILLDNGLSVYQYYMGQGVRIRKKYRSPLRPGEDRDPSFSLFPHETTGKIWFSDFTIPKTGSHWDFVKELYGISYKEAVDLVKRDILGMAGDSPINYQPIVKTHKTKLKTLVQDTPVLIEPKIRNWSEFDLARFEKAHIHLPTLQKYWANPWDSFQMTKEGRAFPIFSAPSDPIYGFSFPSGNQKVYRPENPKFKWTSNTRADIDVFGLHTLPAKCDKIMLMAGNRDTLGMHDLTGIPAIALNSETVMLSYELYEYLMTITDRLFCVYDDDPTGNRMMARLAAEYGVVAANQPITSMGLNDFTKVTETMVAAKDSAGLLNLRDFYLGL